MEALHNFFSSKKESIVLFESTYYVERAAKFAKRGSCEIRTLSYSTEWWNGRSPEWRNILRRGMTEYLKTRNAFWYGTKVSTKWNCDAIRKCFKNCATPAATCGLSLSILKRMSWNVKFWNLCLSFWGSSLSLQPFPFSVSSAVLYVVLYRRSLNDQSQPECIAAKWPFSTFSVLQ